MANGKNGKKKMDELGTELKSNYICQMKFKEPTERPEEPPKDPPSE